jgi:RND superfamily putative drug exporter
VAYHLYRLGRWSVRHRWAVVAVWLTVLVAVGAASVALKGPTDDGFSVPGTEAQRAIDLLAQKFPGTGGATARVVVAAPPGHTLDEARYRGLLSPTLKLVREVPQTVQGTGAAKTPMTYSKDQRIAFGDINFTVPVDKITSSTEVIGIAIRSSSC